MTPQRFVRPSDRHVFALVGAWALVLGALLLADTSANDEVWLPDFWPALLIVGGVLTLAFAVTATSWRLRGLSNAFLVVAMVGRGCAAVLGIADHSAESVARALAELAVFTMVGFLLYVVWRLVVPAGARAIPHA